LPPQAVALCFQKITSVRAKRANPIAKI